MAAGVVEATVQQMTSRDPDTESAFKELTKDLEAEFHGLEHRFRRAGHRGRVTPWALVGLFAVGAVAVGLLQPILGVACFLGAVITADRALR
jgi:hypothetical protein